MKKVFEFLQTPKGLIITAAIILVLVVIVSYNWGKIKGMFSTAAPGAAGRTTQCPPGTYPYRDGQGRIQCAQS